MSRRSTFTAALAFALSVLVIVQSARADGRPPTFADHPVASVYRGVPAAVDLSSHPVARTFRTLLRDGTRRGPNFAGRWTVVRLGCGTNCHSFAVVDAVTGRVYPGPEAAALGVDFRLESTLLIVDPPAVVEAELPEALTRSAPSRYYVWHGDEGRWELIYEISREAAAREAR